jgi:hypothetical protein
MYSGSMRMISQFGQVIDLSLMYEDVLPHFAHSDRIIVSSFHGVYKRIPDFDVTGQRDVTLVINLYPGDVEQGDVFQFGVDATSQFFWYFNTPIMLRLILSERFDGSGECDDGCDEC